jgi:acetyl-CoA synthetase
MESSWPIIDKPDDGRPHHLDDYERVRATFRWEDAASLLAGLPGGRGTNIAHEAVDQHVLAGRGDHVALRIVPREGPTRPVTFAELAERTSRFANVLAGLGVEPGETVFVLTGRGLDTFTAVLGSLKHRCLTSPLFSAFGPDPIRQRLELGSGVVLVTTAALYQRKVASIRDSLPALRHVLVAGGRAPEGTIDLEAALAEAAPTYEIGPTDPETPSLLHFTSGTTGTPKGALHVHAAVLAHLVTGRYVLDLQPDDVYWCTADPGWVTGTSYGIIAPLVNGVVSVVDEAEFDADRWYRLLAQERVTVWYTAPTAIRMLMKMGPEAASGHDLSALRFAASVGEPLGPDAVVWGRDVLGRPFHDNWWQTETGGIMVANYATMPVKPGSMGRPVPGIDVAVLRCTEEGELVLDDGAPVVLTEPGEEGMLALRPGWPSMFRAYLNKPERYAKAFAGGWYLSGDLVRADADGYLWFVSRADDVIKTAGHLIGPFEVETVLRQHPAVADAGVYGVPDPVAGNVIHAAIVLRAGQADDEALQRDLLAHARRHLGPAVAPREFVMVSELPRTRSGKIMRRLLRARELGLPEGDTSTLEGLPDTGAGAEGGAS